MKIAIVAPSPIPYTVGGAEKLWWGLLQQLNQRPEVEVELIKIPSPENDFWALMSSYRRFSELDLTHFDLIISTKYPAWMVQHPNHHCYLQHKLRGLYDTYHFSGQPEEITASHHGSLQELLTLLNKATPEFSDLPTLWTLLATAKDKAPVESFTFPGPLTRKIVHFLDDIALSPKKIKRFSAISKNVASRKDYFPKGEVIEVSHHPSDLEGLHSHSYENFFTISRLDAPKRIKLLIEAFMQTKGDIQFRIAGSGPEAEALKTLAEPDTRIKFLGRITDKQVVEEYATALCVPFVPYDEDYGLITIEAMQAAKAVITTEDAGGPNEFVENGKTGYSLPTNAAAIAKAMQSLIDNASLAKEMGEQARLKVAHISWENTLNMLLKNNKAALRPVAGKRAKIVVVVNFTVWPPQGGGQSRVYHLYREVAKVADITIVSQASVGKKVEKRALSPGLIEISLPKSQEQEKEDRQLDRQLQASVGDIAVIDNYRLSPNYLSALKLATEEADLVIASHPYLYNAIRDVYRGRLWYEAHNVEFDMKRAVLKEAGSDAQPYLDKVKQTEQCCSADAEKILVCSEEDAKRLAALYGQEKAKFLLAPNGVAVKKKHYIKPLERMRYKKRLGLAERFTALFMGSWHGPNIEAVEQIKIISEQLPECEFIIFGSVCDHPVCEVMPRNVHALGLLDEQEKRIWMSSADIAINPMQSGSGTNLKMLDYAAAGLPIVTTEFGNRGLDFRNEDELFVVELEAFPQKIKEIMNGEEVLSSVIENSYQRVCEQYDWAVIVQPIKALI